MHLRPDRLSSLDQFFLSAEGPSTPMHMAATLVFDSGPLRRGRRTVDVAALRAHVASRLHRSIRYRQRLMRTLVGGRMVWIDDRGFDLSRHVHHRRLERTARERDMRNAAADIVARPLERSRPLWELTILDGWSEQSFAVVMKIHHCMADGIGGVDQLAALLSAEPDEAPDDPPGWRPRAGPDLLDLMVEDLSGVTRAAEEALDFLGHALREPAATGTSLQRTLGAVSTAARAIVHPAMRTPINRAVGPERRLEWLAMPLAEIRFIKRRLGGTLNDVVLAIVTGALRRYLGRRGVRFGVGEGEVRAAVPVSMRERGSAAANQVSLWLLPLPVDESDPVAALARTRATTSRLRGSGEARELYSLLRLAEALGPTLSEAGVYLVKQLLPFNVVVTNVPGPKGPLYMNGARLRAIHPCVPLFERQGLGIALLGYDGTLFWGFLADPEILPDLEELVYAAAVSFGELLDRAAAEQPPVEAERFEETAEVLSA
ncbi:MAG: diacylglycerol O-acyltransferase / wax synthase [Candidatus Binatota bacterium]|nr:diacylglycerol O-acyltransferase / wax synthase [Candidatus Binatota bacterium]